MLKKGITVTMIAVTVIILAILASTITISVYSSMNYAKLSAWTSEIANIQDVVNEEIKYKSALNSITSPITIDTSGMDQEEIDKQFIGENIASDGNVELNVLDLAQLKITNTVYGKLSVPEDVYAVSLATGRVYYVKGLEISNKIYYSLTVELENKFNLPGSDDKLSSVIFVPNKIGYSNVPITVTVKLPKTFSNITVTTSNANVNIGPQNVLGQMYIYNVNTNSIAENYKINVSYNDGAKDIVASYEVNGYDNVSPDFNNINQNDFIYKETASKKTSYLSNILPSDNFSGIKSIKYEAGAISSNNAKDYFNKNGKYIRKSKLSQRDDVYEYTIYIEDNAGNYAVKVVNFVQDSWRPNVVAIIDSVPIPKGFVASSVPGENTKDQGLVIYEGTTAVTNQNVGASRTTRNQYVWVPVDNFSDFKRKAYNNLTIGNTLGATDYWEISLDTNTNMPLTTQDMRYISEATIGEATSMYESVKNYGGFYISRYEASKDINNSNKVASIKDAASWTNIPWSTSANMSIDTGGAVEKSRELYNVSSQETGVVSTLTYAVQWDAAIYWMRNIDNPYVPGTKYITNSIGMGNYKNSEIKANDGTTVLKPQGTILKLKTGITDQTKINNIYDLAGNIWEYTMEGTLTVSRSYHGGYYAHDGSTFPTSYRNNCPPTSNYDSNGFRPSLYIKNPKNAIPDDWRQNVVAVVDTVPIPKGFVASSVPGENTKEKGLVIYEGNTAVTSQNVGTARTTRNQYVWVPVNRNTFTTTFVRKPYTEINSSQTVSNTLGTYYYWEAALDTIINMPLSTQDMTYMTQATLTEIQEMYASVKKYEGFYVGRYEMGIDIQRTSNTTILKGLENVHSKMNKIPYNYISWSSSNTMNIDTGGAVEVARSLYPKTNISYGAASTLIYGVQWDAMLNWYVSSNAVPSVIRSTIHGNYRDNTITLSDVNDGAKYSLLNASNLTLGSYTDITESTIKDTATSWGLTTGALKRAKVNNIYDIAGNMHEWTMEGNAPSYRGVRGGNYYDASATNPFASRNYNLPTNVYGGVSARPTLYIK